MPAVRRALADAGRTVRSADLAIAYCGIVTAVTVVLNVIDAEDKERIIQEGTPVRTTIASIPAGILAAISS